MIVLILNLWADIPQGHLLDSLEFKKNQQLKVLILDEEMRVLEIIEVEMDKTNQLTLNLPKDKKVYVTFVTSQNKESPVDSTKLPTNLKDTTHNQLISSLKQGDLNQDFSSNAHAIVSSEKTLYEGRYERNKFMGGLLGFEPHKFNYIIPANVSTAKEPNQRKQVETKFQISIKKELIDDLLIKDLDLYFAYTQQSFWQLYDSQNSRPFRESNYEPSLYLTYPLEGKNLFLIVSILAICTKAMEEI